MLERVEDETRHGTGLEKSTARSAHRRPAPSQSAAPQQAPGPQGPLTGPPPTAHRPHWAPTTRVITGDLQWAPQGCPTERSTGPLERAARLGPLHRDRSRSRLLTFGPGRISDLTLAVATPSLRADGKGVHAAARRRGCRCRYPRTQTRVRREPSGRTGTQGPFP